MAESVKVVVDAMGGDYAPVEPVKGAVQAVKERPLKKNLANPRISLRTGSRSCIPAK